MQPRQSRFGGEAARRFLKRPFVWRSPGPRHADYEATRKVALARFNKKPVAVIRIGNAADVAAVINFVRATDLPLAIRSGGHSTVPGARA